MKLKSKLILTCGIFVAILCIALLSIQTISLIEQGDLPVFAITLKDNGENDYIDLKFISSGTGFFKITVPLRLTGFTIEIASIENLSNHLMIGLPPQQASEELSLGENLRVVFNSNVVEAGKTYNIILRRNNSYLFGADVGCE